MLQPPLLEEPPFHALLSPSYSAPGICQLGPSPLSRPPFVASVKAFCLPPFLPPPPPAVFKLPSPSPPRVFREIELRANFPTAKGGRSGRERGGEKGRPRK